MNEIITLISLSVIFGSMLSGFATFRMTGMRLMPHFASLILAFVFTVASLFIDNNIIHYMAIALQIITPFTICGTICNILKTQFQNTGIYSAHLGFMGIMLILAIGNLLI
ncbi:DUF5400 domain-containing protein [Methanococcus aeolicus]|jgi:sugar phosphate permease|uniref:Uncharacterized protein n=1 Tax=Methanococcus aeolicus (strain ATCC BAA-1280 / DSM 17508 / OCM 812 / Nankai-3) TaxID=419665 RepID=A6UUB4_META3|nr:DUF5400 domain-containing protein [Methanococcus aeolicus]ABR56086.1 conserved hypothetical protein [Methanococcus aeolicus Nankai-3]UXM85311.1 DUF5400 domain-containing protein [Methanococcus aeolicus]